MGPFIWTLIYLFMWIHCMNFTREHVICVSRANVTKFWVPRNSWGFIIRIIYPIYVPGCGEHENVLHKSRTAGSIIGQGPQLLWSNICAHIGDRLCFLGAAPSSNSWPRAVGMLKADLHLVGMVSSDGQLWLRDSPIVLMKFLATTGQSLLPLSWLMIWWVSQPHPVPSPFHHTKTFSLIKIIAYLILSWLVLLNEPRLLWMVPGDLAKYIVK